VLCATLKIISTLCSSKVVRDKEADAQVLQCVAVCCSELQCVAVCYSVLVCVCSAVCYTENNFNIVSKQSGEGQRGRREGRCVMQHVVMCCNVLQCVVLKSSHCCSNE